MPAAKWDLWNLWGQMNPQHAYGSHCRESCRESVLSFLSGLETQQLNYIPGPQGEWQGYNCLTLNYMHCQRWMDKVIFVPCVEKETAHECWYRQLPDCPRAAICAGPASDSDGAVWTHSRAANTAATVLGPGPHSQSGHSSPLVAQARRLILPCPFLSVVLSFQAVFFSEFPGEC